jgi:acetyl esterase/lipase
MRNVAFGFAFIATFVWVRPAMGVNAPQDGQAIATAFGAREYVRSPELSPDGTKLVFVAPAEGRGTVAVVTDLKTGEAKGTVMADGAPLKLQSCGWSANDRIVCTMYGISTANGPRLSYTRLVAFDADGSHQISLARRAASGMYGEQTVGQYDGDVIDWMSGDGVVLMTRNFVPQQFTTGSIASDGREGSGVELVDTRTNSAHLVEQPNREVEGYFSDGHGVVRIMAIGKETSIGMLKGDTVFRYRLAGERSWRPFSTVTLDGPELRPIVVDGALNVAYATQKVDGRAALYRVALDGTMKADLVYADPHVDVDGVETVGRRDRVIGATYTTDQPHIKYTDPEYEKLAAQLGKALPGQPQIDFASASADERKLLILAARANAPGRYYLLDRDTNKMVEVVPYRPALSGFTFGEVKYVTYPAADGTLIPAYLTLPPGSAGKSLPTIVMPHGGPEARDYGGFDFLSQFFAERGFAVLQPEYRGSVGYGDAFFNKNGFKSWRTAIGDVTDAGRWLVAQGIADPDKLAIFGWSYGGYAALQSNVIAPTLFKAVVAVAPLTDFGMAVDESRKFTNFEVEAARFGNGAFDKEGSPDRHASVFQAPVLMFHGDNDLNVDIAESRAMDAALHHAGKQSRLVVYPGLDHQLDDSKARADMLAQSDTFLRETLKIAN